MNLPSARPLVYCISEGRATPKNFHEIKQDILAKVRNADTLGVHIFQIREKQLPALLLFELAREAVQAAACGRVRLLLNGRADVAIAAGAHGVHLPADGVPVRELRRLMPEEFIVGVSTHSVEEVMHAKEGGADLVTFGPVFASPGKGDGVGVGALRRACSAAGSMPVIALGGVDESSAAAAMENGAAGYAAIRYLNRVLGD